MDINYELYKVFYYVATTLSFSEASKLLFISQSAVSQSIKVLEKKLGITLFIRSTKLFMIRSGFTARCRLSAPVRMLPLFPGFLHPLLPFRLLLSDTL